VREDRHLDAEDRRGDGGAEQRLVPLVVGVGDQRDAGASSSGRVVWMTTSPPSPVEGETVVGAGRSRSSSSAWATAVGR
jgi:hypothetical protein